MATTPCTTSYKEKGIFCQEKSENLSIDIIMDIFKKGEGNA
jgi:hypothetical protein